MPNCAAFLRIVAVGRPMRLAIVSSDCDAAASSISSRCCLYDHVPIFRLPTRAIIFPSPSAQARPKYFSDIGARILDIQSGLLDLYLSAEEDRGIGAGASNWASGDDGSIIGK